ncbi:MAG: hypothetical protein KDD92_03545 [Caldilineaceae bacterium]|nr:hypothetical protein [Caldilineaceae bacterium]
MQSLPVKVLFATSDEQSLALLHSLLNSAVDLMCFEVHAASTTTQEELRARVAAQMDDVIFLDWDVAEAGTPMLVETLIQQNPQIRAVVLLPLDHRQYREKVWCSGACNSIPKEHMDQEWLSSILCVMYRAMQREQVLRAELAARSASDHSTEVRAMQDIQ